MILVEVATPGGCAIFVPKRPNDSQKRRRTAKKRKTSRVEQAEQRADLKGVLRGANTTYLILWCSGTK